MPTGQPQDPQNPYAPPESLASLPASEAAAPRPAVLIPTGRRTAILILLGVAIAMTGLALLILAAYPEMLTLDDDADPTAEQLVPMVGFTLLYVIGGLCRVAYFIVFLSWEYRCYANLSYFAGAAPRFSEGWAVGYWFIPFVNLVRPIQVVGDLVNGNRFAEPHQRPRDRSWLVALWWLLFIGSNVISKLTDHIPGVGMVLLSELLGIASWVITGALVVVVTRLQLQGYIEPGPAGAG